jgi:hypothetical protein
MADPVFIGLLGLIAAMTLLRRHLVVRMRHRSGEVLPRFLLSTFLLRKYKQVFGADGFYILAQVSTYLFLVLVVVWLLCGPQHWR